MLTGDLRRRWRAQDGGHGSKGDEEDLEHGCLKGEVGTSETVGEVRSGKVSVDGQSIFPVVSFIRGPVGHRRHRIGQLHSDPYAR